MPDMPAKMPAARRGELASEAIEDIFQLLGRHRIPAQPFIRHLTHVYWNMRYVGQYVSVIARIERAKAEGIEWADFLEQARLRFKREDEAALEKALCEFPGPLDPLAHERLREIHCRRQVELAACLDLLPDHLLSAEGEIVWTQERPHRTFVSSRINKEAADPQPDDPLDPK
jgi:hypothetical protein